MSKRTTKTDSRLSSQRDLFDTGMEEGALEISLGFRQCLSRSIHGCGKDRYLVAAEVSRLTKSNFSKDMLDKYTSSDPAYGLRAEVLTALCQVIGNMEPFRYLLEPLGYDLIGPDDAKFLKLAKLEEQRRALDLEIQQLRSKCGIR